ncbi:hypothetical protein Tco_0091968 [Tanacetum coccineum]
METASQFLATTSYHARDDVRISKTASERNRLERNPRRFSGATVSETLRRYTPLVSPFLDSDDESDDGEVLNELDEYGNAGFFLPGTFTYIFRMPRMIPRLKNFNWSKVPPILELSQQDLMSGHRYSDEKNKFMYKNCLNLCPDYQVDEDMKEWLIRGHVSIDGVT